MARLEERNAELERLATRRLRPISKNACNR